MAKYFGTNGIRGTYDKLNPKLALELSIAIGEYFKKNSKEKKPKILVAQDYRLTGDSLKHAVISGLLSIGIDSVDLGVISSPTAEFMVKKLKASGLIIITASHNPPEWNALKVVDKEGVAVSKERGEEIEKLIGNVESCKWNQVGKNEKYTDAIDEHIHEIISQINTKKLKAKKIVLDCGNGTAADIAPKLFEKLCAKIILINEKGDGTFPNRPSEPSELNVQKLISKVKAENADAGIAWDGDGDRVIFVDEKGNYIIGDKVFALCALWEMEENKGNAVTTVATSKVIEEVAQKYNRKVIYTAIGAPYLSEEVAKGGYLIGGEEVGGVIFPKTSLAKDGFLTAAKMYEKICEKPLSKWHEEIPKYFNVKTKIDANEKEKKEIVQRVLKFAKSKQYRISTIDGVRIDFDDSWVIIRSSGTENYVRIFAEAKSQKRAEELVKEYLEICKK